MKWKKFYYMRSEEIEFYFNYKNYKRRLSKASLVIYEECRQFQNKTLDNFSWAPIPMYKVNLICCNGTMTKCLNYWEIYSHDSDSEFFKYLF